MKILEIILFTVCAVAFDGEEDPLHKRRFNTGVSETKNGVISKKVKSDVIYFKNGKLFSDFIYHKFGFKWLRYRINKDSVYTDHTDTQVRYLQVEASATDESNQTVFFDFTVLEWDLDGTIRITRNDKLRYYYDIAGREKGGKPRKEKKKRETVKPEEINEIKS